MSFDFTVISRAGLTQEEFANIAGVSRVTTNMWVRSKVQPHKYVSAKIATVLRHLECAISFGTLPLPPKTDRTLRAALLRAAIISAVNQQKVQQAVTLV